jgi:hypothetical protein
MATQAAPNQPPSTQPPAARPGNEKPRGYHKVANLMGAYSETAIFRRFGYLNMLNLLYLQAELMELEAKFQTICADDAKGISGEPKEKEYAFDFRRLRESGSTINHDQLDTLQDIQVKLEKYSMYFIFFPFNSLSLCEPPQMLGRCMT